MEIKFTNTQINRDTIELAKKIQEKLESMDFERYYNIYPILRGGYYVAVELSRILNIPLTNKIGRRTLIVDDLIDSGKTLSKYPDNDSAVLYVKNNKSMEVDYFVDEFPGDTWLVFPWEKDEDTEDLVVRLIELIGDDPSRPGLKETPKRVIKMYKELFTGYSSKEAPKITVFKNGSDGISYDEMIIDSGNFYSFCEHHILPFYGKYWIAYIPKEGGNIIGLSKLARIVDYHSARLQVQERLVQQIANHIWDVLGSALGIAVVMRGEHLCKTIRGAKKQGEMTTSCLLGVFKSKPEVRQEFMNFVRSS